MTLDEARTHCADIAANVKGGCPLCAEEHIILAEWLTELSEYRTTEEQRNKGCNWCIGFCPDVTGDAYSDYKFCPMCGRKLSEATDAKK